MKNELDTLCYISEQTSYPEDYSKDFGYTVTDRGNRFYITFDAVMQSFGVRNRNGREYDQANVWDRIVNDETIQDYLRRNAWLGEIDHPAPEKKGEELTLQRIGTPNYKYTSHYIRKPRMVGSFLEATIQTDSSNENGMNMAIKMVDGKIIPCFSARVFGSMQNRNGRPIVIVRKLLTYDWVPFPSHREAEAKIKQPVMESASIEDTEKITGVTIIRFPELAKMAANNSKETEWLCESFGLDINNVTGLTSTGNSVVIQEKENVYVQPLSDRRIRQRSKSMLNDWLNK